MKPSVRWLVIVGSVIVVVVLFALLRPQPAVDDATPTPSTPTPTLSPSVSESPSPSPSPPPARTTIEVTYRNGSVQGRTEFTATQGDPVRIVIHADVTDEVHLHGYDLMADVGPGAPARIDFVANAAGVYECELEDAGTLLFRLEIVP
jgi:heme/copper-type cytochrome/quinol oxidase subunit 2